MAQRTDYQSLRPQLQNHLCSYLFRQSWAKMDEDHSMHAPIIYGNYVHPLPTFPQYSLP